MSVEIGTDLELIEHLDFDYAPPCQSKNEHGEVNCPTNAAATWRTVSVCCGKANLLCDTCLERKSRVPVITTCGQKFNPGRLSWSSIDRL